MNSNSKPDSKRKTKKSLKTQTNPESQPHLKTQHRLFALALFSGLSQRAAYLQAYPSASPRTAEVQSSRLITRPDIRATLDHLHSQVETQAILTLQEKRAYLARIVRTSATDVRPGTDLVQAITTAKDGSQTLRMPDKLRAIYLDARLAGELPPLNRPQASPPSEPQRPAHETILNQALKSICFGTNPTNNTATSTSAGNTGPQMPTTNPPASSSPHQLEPITEPKQTPTPSPPLIPNPAYQLWPPRPPLQTVPPPTPAALMPPATTPQPTPAPPPAPQTPSPNLAQPSPPQQPQQSSQAKPEDSASSTPPPYIPTIRRRHIRLGRRPWGPHTPQQNSGEISQKTPAPAPAPQCPTPQR